MPAVFFHKQQLPVAANLNESVWNRLAENGKIKYTATMHGPATNTGACIEKK
jgi:hypothetical protein